MQTVHLTIGGMSCGHCVSRVRAALGSVDGVRVHDVRVGSADLEFDPATSTVDRIAGALADVGFEVTSPVSPAA